MTSPPPKKIVPLRTHLTYHSKQPPSPAKKGSRKYFLLHPKKMEHFIKSLQEEQITVCFYIKDIFSEKHKGLLQVEKP